MPLYHAEDIDGAMMRREKEGQRRGENNVSATAKTCGSGTANSKTRTRGLQRGAWSGFARRRAGRPAA